MTQAQFNFDVTTGESRKKHGMGAAAARREVLLEKAKHIAIDIAKERGAVTYDDVFRRMLDHGLNPTELGNAAGSVFRGEEFVFTGEWRKSERVSNHARVNRVWTLKRAA